MSLWYEICEIAADPVAREERRSEYVDLNCQLCRKLGLWWGHMIFPIDAVTAEPPGWMARNALQSDAWRAAHSWRNLLGE